MRTLDRTHLGGRANSIDFAWIHCDDVAFLRNAGQVNFVRTLEQLTQASHAGGIVLTGESHLLREAAEHSLGCVKLNHYPL